MSGEIVPFDDVERVGARVAGVLRAGGLAVVPSDTVHTLLADAFQPAATRALAVCKQRDAASPLTVLIRSPRQVSGLVAEVSEAAERLMASYWPGPLTLVFPLAEGLTWDIGLTGGTVALRMPSDDLLLAVIADVGPLACSAANRSGEPVTADVAGVRAQLGDDAVGVYVDDGPRAGAVSTVVDVTGAQAVVLRAGAVAAADVDEVARGTVGWGARPER
jgi:L-threonylcarbamoyladenylate synthase